MSRDVEWRRKSYLAIIRDADEQAAKSNDERAAKGFLTVAEGYRVLLRRLEQRQKSKAKTARAPADPSEVVAE